MTLDRRAGSVEEVLFSALRALSENEVNAATGKSLTLFYRVSNPSKRDTLSLDDAAALDAALVKKGLSPAFSVHFERVKANTLASIGGAAEHEVMNPADRLTHLLAEVGNIASELRASTDAKGLGGPEIVESEASSILSKSAEARAALERLDRDVLASVGRKTLRAVS